MTDTHHQAHHQVFCCYCSCYVSSPHQCVQIISIKPDMQPYDQARLGQVYAASHS